MRSAKQGVALDIMVQATVVAAGDADPTAGTITIAIQKWRQGDSGDGYYYTGTAWQAGAATVTSTQLSAHGHMATVDATRMAGLAGFDISARPASATAIGPTSWVHVATEAGTGSWEYAPAGSSQVTITVNDGANPLENVQVDVYNSGNTGTPLRSLFTDVAGQVAFAIDDGSYKVRLSLSLYAFTVPETLTVSGTTTDTYTGQTLVSIDPPAGADLCRIFGTMKNAGFAAVPNATVTATAQTPQVVAGVRLGDPVASTTTDANGAFLLDLERGAKVHFACERAAVASDLTVPDATTQDWSTWVT